MTKVNITIDVDTLDEGEIIHQLISNFIMEHCETINSWEVFITDEDDAEVAQKKAVDSLVLCDDCFKKVYRHDK